MTHLPKRRDYLFNRTNMKMRNVDKILCEACYTYGFEVWMGKYKEKMDWWGEQ